MEERTCYHTRSLLATAENDAKALRDQLSSFVDDPTFSSSVTEIKKDKSKGSARDKTLSRHTRRQEADAREWESDEEDKPQCPGGQTRKQIDLQLRTRWPRSFRKTNRNDANANESRIRENGMSSPSTFGGVIKTRPKKSSRIIRPRPRAPGAIAEAGPRRQLADDTVARTLAMPSPHERSRQEYLTKCELHQVELRRKEIADDEALFRGMRISKREQRKLDHKKEDLKFVEERLRIDDKWDGYVQPEDYLTEQGKIDKSACYTSGTRKRSPRTTSSSLMSISGRPVRLHIARSKLALWISLNSWTLMNICSKKAR